MIGMRHCVTIAALAATTVMAACEDGLIRPPAPAGPASVRIAASLGLLNGGPAEAYQKVNQLSVRFLAGATERLAQVVPFGPGVTETVVTLQVPLEDVTETLGVEVELRANGQALFRGSTQAQLTAGSTSDLVIPFLQPVVSGVTCAGTPFPIAVYNAARRLTAAALFASGDTVTGITFGWNSGSPSIATVNQAGDVIGLQDGNAQISCSYQGLTSNRTVQVFGVVAAVQLLPAQDTVVVGTNATFTATRRDSLGNVISGPRTTAWSSSNDAIATVSGSGVATGVAPGTVTITAASGTGSGSATLLVVFPPPLVNTAAATSLGATTATLNGSVNPQGAPATAWFEYGTAANLSGAISTTPQQLGPGNTFQAVSQQVGSLLANQAYYFRAVGSSAGGTTRGSILSFTTPSPPVVRTISGTPVLSGATLQGGVNPQGLATQAWFEWSTSPSLANAQQTTRQQLAAGRTEVPTSASLGNLAPGVTYYFRAAASNTVGTTYGQILSVRANSPPVTTTVPATLAGLNATLHGTVNPGGLSTSAWFEWGLSPSLSDATPTANQNIGGGTADVAVSTPLGNLSGGRTYYFRVVANNQLGTSNGVILSFVAPLAPTVATLAPSGITGTSATLWGSVNPNGSATIAWFEWGAGAAPTSFSRTATQAIGSGTQAVTVPQALGGLSPGGTYSYRVAAGNAADTTRGNLVTFSTFLPPGVITQPSYYYDFGAGTYSYLWGTITPQPFDTEVWFEYSTTSATLATYASTPIYVIPVGGDGELGFDFYDSVPGVVWFRAVARHAGGTTRGAILRTTQPIG